jgi:hypothetical protein
MPASAQQRKMKLDSLGLPPFPGANNVGHISLPLKDILKPKPGEHPTGPALNDLAIQTYRTPLSVTVDRIAGFYLKYAQQLGWKLLDDIPDSATVRSLVFWSPDAPGYLTVDILAGPSNTRQIDLTRLLGDVNPSRPGEVMKLTGKRIREQRVDITYAGRFLDLKTNTLTRANLKDTEDRSESGLPSTAAVRLAPQDETYAEVIRVSDTTKHMTSADAYAANNTLIGHAESKSPTGSLVMIAKVRATQGLVTRVVVMGREDIPGTPVTPTPAPMTKAGKPAVRSASAASKKAVTRPPAKATPPVAKPAIVYPPTNHIPVRSITPPPVTPVVLTEWNGLRPPLTALITLRKGSATVKTETAVLQKDVPAGPTCDAGLNKTIDWQTETTDQFTFSPDLFGSGLSRTQLIKRSGTTTVAFVQGSGMTNLYTVSQVKTTSTTDVEIGYQFSNQWIVLPTKKANPETTSYVTTSTAPPQVSKQSSGACPRKLPAKPNP